VHHARLRPRNKRPRLDLPATTPQERTPRPQTRNLSRTASPKNHQAVFKAELASVPLFAGRRPCGTFPRIAGQSAIPVQPSQICRKKKEPKKLPGDCYTVTSYRRAVARACEKASVPKWHPHQLRHNAATNIRKQHGIEIARIILGHSTAFTTEIYAEQLAVEVIAKIG